jgi:hypothetical protein
VSKKLERLSIANFECQELVDALFFQGGQPFYQFGLQRGVRETLRHSGDDVLYF